MTMQELPERRTPKIDLNLLPDEYLPRKKSRWGLLLVLLVVVLACVPWPFLILKADVDADNRRLESEKAGLEAEFSAIMRDAGEAAALQKDIEAANADWNDILADWEVFQASIRTWSEIMYDVQQLPRGSLGDLNTINQNSDVISIDGWFSREQFVYEYALMLADTGHFVEDGVNIKQTTYQNDQHNFKIEAILVPVGVE